MRPLCPLLILVSAARAGAADLLLEDAAWGPLASRTTGVIGAEQRPSQEQIVGVAIRALVVGGTATRLVGADAIERAGSRVGDAGASLALVDDDHGYSSGNFFGTAQSSRRSLYLRAGTDPGARVFGRPIVAGGGDLIEAIGAAPLSLHVDVGWSDERGTVWLVEGGLPLPLPVHAIGEGDDARRTFRTGLCLRWPGGALARTPDEDPWMADVAVDYVSTHDAAADVTTRGALAEVSVAWRFTDHWYLAGQACAANHARRGDGSVRATLTAFLGLGATW